MSRTIRSSPQRGRERRNFASGMSFSSPRGGPSPVPLPDYIKDSISACYVEVGVEKNQVLTAVWLEGQTPSFHSLAESLLPQVNEHSTHSIAFFLKKENGRRKMLDMRCIWRALLSLNYRRYRIFWIALFRKLAGENTNEYYKERWWMLRPYWFRVGEGEEETYSQGERNPIKRSFALFC